MSVVVQDVDSVSTTGDDSTNSTLTTQATFSSLASSSAAITPAQIPTQASSAATTLAVASAATYEYFDEETFDSEFDSDEEFGKRKRKKAKLMKVSFHSLDNFDIFNKKQKQSR